MDNNEKILVFLETCIQANDNNGVTSTMASKLVKHENELLKPLAVKLFELNDNVLYFKDFFANFIDTKEKNIDKLIMNCIKAYLEFYSVRLNPYSVSYSEINVSQMYHFFHLTMSKIIDIDAFSSFMHKIEFKKLYGEEAQYEEGQISMYSTHEYLLDTIDRILSVNNVIDKILEFMNDDYTNIYFIKTTTANTIFLEKCEDFRIYQWEKERIKKCIERFEENKEELEG